MERDSANKTMRSLPRTVGISTDMSISF